LLEVLENKGVYVIVNNSTKNTYFYMKSYTDFKISMPNFDKFPITRYQGSKRKIRRWLYDNVKNLEFNSVLDAFGGSGTVSYLFKQMGKEVTYNDKLKFNSIIGKAIIENQRNKFTEKDIQDLYEWIENNPHEQFIQENFGGIYYPRRENIWLDGMNTGILNMNHYRGETLENKKALAYYALFQACLIKRPFNLFHRRNLNIRTANVERKFGNKVTWEQPFDGLFTRFIGEVNSLVFNSGVDCQSTNQSVFDIEEGEHDLVYLDPPYFAAEGSNENSNYLKCYHFLEGLANYDEWPDLIDYNTPNLRFEGSEVDRDFNKENITHTLEELIWKFQESTIVISYKSGGIPSIAQLVEIMKRYKGHVYTTRKEYSYSLNRNNGGSIKEVLIIGV
jgi:adenine-specific DNA-methyltransferase